MLHKRSLFKANEGVEWDAQRPRNEIEWSL